MCNYGFCCLGEGFVIRDRDGCAMHFPSVKSISAYYLPSAIFETLGLSFGEGLFIGLLAGFGGKLVNSF